MRNFHISDFAAVGPRTTGVATRSDLLRVGLRAHDISRLVAVGSLRRLRAGWYALPWADPLAERAVRAGGVLTCASALKFHGVWLADPQGLHVRGSRSGLERSTLRIRPCQVPGPAPTPQCAVDPVDTALSAASRCLTVEELVVATDSILNLRLLEVDDVCECLARSAAGRRALPLIDIAESGTESLTRLRLRRLGISLRPQAPILGVGRVDLLVGTSLVLECDSVAHHTDLAAYTRDRARDQELVKLGYSVIRLTYAQVMYDWPRVEGLILTLVRRKAHLKPIKCGS